MRGSRSGEVRTVGDLPTALFLAIGKGALAKHLESCEVCGDSRRCVVAKAHQRSIDRLSENPTPPGATT